MCKAIPPWWVIHQPEDAQPSLSSGGFISFPGFLDTRQKRWDDENPQTFGLGDCSINEPRVPLGSSPWFTAQLAETGLEPAGAKLKF